MASLGLWFFILSSQVHGTPDDLCHDFQKLQVQKGDEDGPPPWGLGGPGHRGWPACPAATSHRPWFRALSHSRRSRWNHDRESRSSGQEVGLPFAVSLSLWEELPPPCTPGASPVTLSFLGPGGPVDSTVPKAMAHHAPTFPPRPCIPFVTQARAVLSPRITHSGKRITHIRVCTHVRTHTHKLSAVRSGIMQNINLWLGGGRKKT